MNRATGATIAGLIALLAVAAWLRLSLTGYGLPLLLWEDEPIYFRRALALGFGDWNPHYFKKPGFFLYFYYGWYWLAYQAGGWPNWQAYVQAFWQDPTAIALLGRHVSVGLGVASVGLTVALGRQLGMGAWAALAAAGLMAVHPVHVKYSAIVVSDIPALLGILACAWFAVRYYQTGRTREVLISGALAGLTIAFKYNIFTLMLPLAAHGLRALCHERTHEATTPRPWHRRALRALADRRLWLSLALAGLVFLVLCPYTLLDFQAFWADVDLERRHVLLRDAAHATRQFLPMAGFGKIFFHILPKALGWPLMLAAVVSLGLGLWRIRRDGLAAHARGLVLAAFVLTFLLAATQFRLVNAKYLLPVVPFLLLLITSGLADCWRSGRWRYGALSLVLIALAWPLLSDTRQLVAQYRLSDTRTQMHAYLLGRVRPQDVVLIEPEALPVGTPAFPRNVLLRARRTASTWTPVPERLRDPVPALAGARWLVMRVKPLKTPQGQRVLPLPPAYYAQIARQFVLVKAFTPSQAASPAAQTFPPRGLMQGQGSLEAALLQQYPRWSRCTQGPPHPGPVLLLWQRAAHGAR